MNEKNILLAARVVSLLFTPYYLPVVGLIALFTFSYLSMLPRGYQLTMLLIVYLSTVLLPHPSAPCLSSVYGMVAHPVWA